MKKPVRNLLCALLCAAILRAAVPLAAQAAPVDLRKMVAAQAIADASVEWKLSSRIARLNHSEEKKEAMYAAGVQPTSYFEYNRVPIVLRGVLVENNNATLESFSACKDAGGTLLPGAGGAEDGYIGMNANSFLLDVVSRVSPVKFTTVKEAINSSALVALVSKVDTSAASSSAAMSGSSYSAARTAYARLGIGDILVAWDNAGNVETTPRLHVMVVTDLEELNEGQVTVTYPGYEQPTYYFKCDKCGAIETEGPTSAVLTKYMISESSKFSRYAKHAETNKGASCSGTWAPMYATTWHTETVSFEQLFGQNGKSVPAGGTRYIPYTLAAYSADSVSSANVKVTTDASAANISSGFKAQIDSDYRITRVDAVLSHAGEDTQVFTNYPAWDAWSYTYQNAELDKVLNTVTTGVYTLSLKVTAGPAVNGAEQTAVVTPYTLDLSLEPAAFAIDASAEKVEQGDVVLLNVRTVRAGVTGAEVTIQYDAKRFAFDAAASRKNTSDATFVENSDGSVTVQRFFKAAGNGDLVARVAFRAVRTGDLPIAAQDAPVFASSMAKVATKSGAGVGDLAPSRAEGVCRVGIGHNTVIYKNYTRNCDLLLLFVEGMDATATYNETAMTDVSFAHYLIDGKGFTDTFAILLRDPQPSAVSAELNFEGNANTYGRMLLYSYDVNCNGNVDIADVQTICDIINGTLPLEGNQKSYLLADINRDCKVDSGDVLALMKELSK